MKRREFFKKTGLLTAAAFANKFLTKSVWADSKATAAFENRVVWAHDKEATFWEGEGYYGDYVDQGHVNNMLESGIKGLTGQTDYLAAWQQLIPDYSLGKKIAIKININNKGVDNYIDALPAPVIAIIAGLKNMGVLESDIYVMEPSRVFVTRIGYPILRLYPDVLLWDTYWGGAYGHKVTYNSNDPSLILNHMHPDLGESVFPDQMAEIDYLINVPIIKGHPSGAEITLSFKNNFGFFKDISRFHPYCYPSNNDYSYDMNPLIDIALSPHIKDKAVLIVGDALFGHRISNTGIPEVWNTFNGEFPNSLFLSADPVAIDSVMWDFSNAEYQKVEQGQLYLHKAHELGLGIHEHWDNAVNRQYEAIDFQKIEMSITTRSDVDQKIREYKNGESSVEDVKNTINKYLKGTEL